MGENLTGCTDHFDMRPLTSLYKFQACHNWTQPPNVAFFVVAKACRCYVVAFLN